MSDPLSRIGLPELLPTLLALAGEGATTKDADWLRSNGNASLVVRLIHDARGIDDHNPYAISAEQQIEMLVEAHREEGWKINERDLAWMRSNPRPWPVGKYAFRVPRVRFEQAKDNGLALTFDCHVRRIERVLPEVHRAPTLLSEQLLLHYDKHTPGMAWTTVDFSSHQMRKGGHSVADELLVLTWMFPKFFREQADSNDSKVCPFIADGYRLSHESHREDAYTLGIGKEYGSKSGQFLLSHISRDVGLSTTEIAHVHG